MTESEPVQAPSPQTRNRLAFWSRFRFPSFRLSLRAMLVLVAIIAVVLGTQYRRFPISSGNVANLQEVASLNKDVYKMAWSPDRTRLALVSWEAPVEIRDMISLKLKETIGDDKKIIQFAFSPVEGVISYCENSQFAVILDQKTGQSYSLNTKNPQPSQTFSPDGKYLATGGYGIQADLWDASNGKHVRSFSMGNSVTGGLTPVFSPDGRLLAVGNRNDQTMIFDVATGNTLQVLPKRSTQELLFNPQGDKLAVSYVNGGIAIWQVSNGALLYERQTSAEEIYTLDWSPDGQILASAGLGSQITLWNPNGLSILRELPTPPWVIGIKFSPDGMNLICAGGDANVATSRRLQVWGIEGSLFTFLHRP